VTAQLVKQRPGVAQVLGEENTRSSVQMITTAMIAVSVPSWELRLCTDCNYMDIMQQHISLLRAGQPILKPVYGHKLVL